MQISMKAGLEELLQNRGIRGDDVQQTIMEAERQGSWITDGSEKIAKARIGKLTVYVQYTTAEDSVLVKSAWAHRVTFAESQE